MLGRSRCSSAGAGNSISIGGPAPAGLTAFMFWLQHGGSRGPARVNAVVAAVRELCKHAVACEWTSPSLLSVLYQAGDDRWLPDEVRGESVTPRGIARPRHRLPEPHRRVQRASSAEMVALLMACRSARDRFIVLALARGLRRGELVSLRREDIHFVLDARGLGCHIEGAHLHVVRRDAAPRGGFAKSHRPRSVPRTPCLCRHGTPIGGNARPAGTPQRAISCW